MRELGKMNGKEEVVRRYKLYLAGPEVFLPNALEHAEKQRVTCRKFDFIPLHPMDNNLDLGNRDIKTAMRIYLGDIGQISRKQHSRCELQWIPRRMHGRRQRL
jgi:hypothetical protein